MSTIEKLTIQGIRSFGPNADDAQSIAFASPVTLILGENGCGKTTIIECLKYALTGEIPPGGDRGKNFVHDPKIFGLTDTLGQIKLQVRNLRGERLSVCRSMKISFRGGKMTFGTQDATVNYMNAAGEDVRNTVDSISKRCGDVDVTMCEFMGVSKAIINNVLFCHQEDSSWPLDEPKKLKEKFDAIFGITEYNKAIEKVAKMRKEETEELKVKDANLRFLTHLKQEMEDKSLCLERAQQKCNDVKENCKRCDEEMKPIDDRLSDIRKIEYEVGKYQALKVELDTKHKNCSDQISSITKKIKKLFEGSLDELDVEIHLFDGKMSAKRNERNSLQETLTRVQAEEKGLQKVYMEKDKKLCVLLQQHQKEKECNTTRAEKMNTLCQQLNVCHSENVEDKPESVAVVLALLLQAMNNEQKIIVDTTAQSDVEEQQRQAEIDKLRIDLTKSQEGIVAMKKQRSSNEKESRELKSKISEIELAAQNLNKLTVEIARIDEIYASMSAKFNQEGLRQEISDSKNKITQLQEQFRKVDERLTSLNAISKLTAEIALKEKELEKKEQEVRRVKNKHADNFRRVFSGTSSPVEVNYRRKLQEVYEHMRCEIKELNEKANALKLKEQSHDIKRKNLKDELLRLDKELETSNESIYETCHSTPYKDLLGKCSTAVSKYQLELGALRSAEAMYKKYIQKIEEDPCCPLCHKNMSSNEASDLTMELSDEIHRLPENIKRTEKLLKEEQKRYDKLLQLQSVIEKVARLEVDIPKRKEEHKNLQAQLAKCADESESLQMMLVEPTHKLELANSMFGDMSLLDEAIKEVSRLKVDIDKLKSKLPEDYESAISIDDLQLEKSTVSAELENERKYLERKQYDYEKTMEGLSQLRDKKNILKDKEIKMQEGLQSLPQLKERHSELQQLIETTDLEMQACQAQVQSLQQKLNTAVSEKARQKDVQRKNLKQLQTKFESHKNIDHDIQRLNAEMMEFQKLNLEIQISRLQDALKLGKQDIAGKTKEISQITQELDTNQGECLNQETLERDLKDNRELKLLQQNEKDLREEKEKLTKQLGDLDFHKVSREKNDLIKKREDGTVRKGELLGQIGEINNQIKKIQKEIDDPKYKDSIRNYRRAYYEVQVARRLIADLGQYRVAMEWSLIQFHTEKMEHINKLIREYWRLIYRGNDIDYIQVQTDEDKSLPSAPDRRRNYNYRVIQCKNNSEIEMRGRCSAGQRVLASLIIRMALAETFSSNCGVLALDEPTTNLDRNNIISLCDALNRIVEERETQTNFMLIIITHDEEFISTLGKISSYQRVFRNDECKSVIRKVKVA